jgi:fructan beta-fructosidase
MTDDHFQGSGARNTGTEGITLSSDRYARRVGVLVVALMCGVYVAGATEKSTPDPLFDQAGFDFHTYTATYDQPNRPQFHFTSREGYINDPNGLIYYDGEWHLYFQHKGQKVWGHAVSSDLVHWEQLEHAIVMHKGHCPARGQIWSGTAIIDHDNVLGKQVGTTKTIVAFFTHTQGAGFHQDGAYSTDRGRTFQLMGNLVPNQGRSKGERDPKVVWDPQSKKWIMIVTAGCNAVFESTDLKKWTRCKDAIQGVGGECPDLFLLPLDGDPANKKWVIANAGARYGVGHLDKGVWRLDEGERLHGFDSGRPRGSMGYAWQTFGNGPDGRVVQIGFVQSGRKGAQAPVPHEGLPFFQQMTFPVELTLRSTPAGMRLFRNPVKEIESLYTATHKWDEIILSSANDKAHLGGLAPDLLDMTCVFTPEQGDKLTFNIRGIAVRYSQADGRIRIANNAGIVGESVVDASPDKKGRVKFRVLLDRTSFEIFVNDGIAAATINCVPVNKSLSIEGSDAIMINHLEINELGSIWNRKGGYSCVGRKNDYEK